MIVSFTLNQAAVTARVRHPLSLLDMLRDEMGVMGAKGACHQGECGSCSVLLDGTLVCSCLVMAADVEGSDVVTVEGLTPEEGLSEVQTALHRAGAVQCGFCTPGIVVAATELFMVNPSPTSIEIKEALAGNICRCTGYGSILRALETLAEERS